MARRIAGHDDELGVVAAEELAVLGGEPGNRLAALDAVGHAGGVAEIHDGFGRQKPPDGPHDGQSPETGIENADRAIHALGSLQRLKINPRRAAIIRSGADKSRAAGPEQIRFIKTHIFCRYALTGT